MDKVTYLYKLEGVDSEWKYMKYDLCANYTLLKPGEYVFKVKAMNRNSSITDEETLRVTIKSPLWKSKWAYYFYFIVILGIVIYICNYVKILKAMVKKQIKEINWKMEENKILYEVNIKKEKFKNDYFVNLSHELRTPINIILSVLQLLTSLENSGNITKDKSKHYIKEKGIELIVDPEIEEKIISCDPKEIERCIINLIGNSVKFTEVGGEIRVLIRDNGDSVSISVKDNGLGISKDDQEFIFKRFEQGENSDSTKVSSSGLGLTLVKYIVELHNGSVSLESEE